MPLPDNRPVNDTLVTARTTSIGATPAAGSTVATKRGRIQRVHAFSEGASSGTITVAVSINGGSSIGSFSFTGGSNARGSGEISPGAAAEVIEGDLITFTPSGGSGATIPGHFYAVIRG
ncbi:MAG: hypothetical protein IT537_24585 [Hyphomicrobiales bacterium]|nr:hypothetical protein [Hyphomicrobiales bacterium]